MASIKKAIRRMKVQYRWRYWKWHQSKRYPELRMSGEWVRSAGFDVGDEFEIRVSKNRLVITKVKNKAQ